MSVVIPAHNEARFIADAVRSIQAQSVPPFEIIVVDDGSSDRTADVAMDCDGPVRMTCIRFDKAQGAANARNRGIDAAVGDWIAMCDADDIWLPDKLKRQLEFIAAWDQPTPLALVGAQGINISEDGAPAGIFNPGLCSVEEFHDRFGGTGVLMVPHSSVLFRKADCVAAGRYTESSVPADDVDFFERLARVTGGVVMSLDEPLIYYRKKRGGLNLGNFWHQQMVVDNMLQNRRRREAGQPELTVEQHVASLRAERWSTRLRRRWQWTGALYYRRGATNFVNHRRVVGGVQLGLATLARPALVRQGVRRYYADSSRA